jgi:ABC-type spermidine/putrescine transport system permease subunit II
MVELYTFISKGFFYSTYFSFLMGHTSFYSLYIYIYIYNYIVNIKNRSMVVE